MVAGAQCGDKISHVLNCPSMKRKTNTRENDSKGKMCKIFLMPKHQPKKPVWVLTCPLLSQCGAPSILRRSISEMMGVGTFRSMQFAETITKLKKTANEMLGQRGVEGNMWVNVSEGISATQKEAISLQVFVSVSQADKKSNTDNRVPILSAFWLK